MTDNLDVRLDIRGRGNDPGKAHIEQILRDVVGPEIERALKRQVSKGTLYHEGIVFKWWIE